jgi:predicted ester cyclase
VDGGLAPERARHMVEIAQLLYTFWNTGDRSYLDRAVEPLAVDNTLPEGRPAGRDGQAWASDGFRKAVPNLRCALEDLLIVGDKLTARLRFTGAFDGTFGAVEGTGQTIDFIAFDIQHVGVDRIIEDWHLEDNLTFMRQAGILSA